MATVVNGTNLLIYVNGTAIGGSKTCKLTMSHDPIDTFTKDDAGWATEAAGKRSWAISCDGLVAFDTALYALSSLADLIINRTKVSVKFSTNTSQQQYFYGDAYLKTYDVDGGVEDSISYSANFEGTGVLTKATKT
jgi:predicted secreted protein